MADPAWDSKIAAAKAAMAGLGIDDASEAERAVAVFWSQVPLLPAFTPAPPSPVPGSKPRVVAASVLESDDPAIQEDLAEIEVKVQAVLRKMAQQA